MSTGISMSGMASGMDTDGIIEQMMALERAPIQRMEQEKEEISNEREHWQKINQQLSGLQQSFDSLGEVDNYRQMNAVSGNENLMTVTADDSADEASYNVEVRELAQNHMIHGTQFDSVTDDLGLGEQNFTISIGEGEEATFNLEGGESLQEIRDIINADENLEVSASIVDNRLVLNGDMTGSNNDIELGGALSEDENILGFYAEDEETGEPALNEMQRSQDAEFTINGMDVTRSHNDGIDDVLEGVTIDLHGAREGETFNVDIGRDIETVEEAINTFVEDYNEMQSFLQQMGGDEGPLQGDGTLRRLQSSMRSTIMTGLDSDNDINHVQDLGIEIDDQGMMSFDSNSTNSQISDGISNNLEAIEEFFTASQSENDGFSERISGFIENYVRSGSSEMRRGIIENRDNNLQSSIDRIDRRIEAREDRIARREETMRRQFNRMEVALNDMQAQGSWLQGQLQQLQM